MQATALPFPDAIRGGEGPWRVLGWWLVPRDRRDFFPVMKVPSHGSDVADDRIFAARITDGDEDAFGDLVTRFKHKVLGTASRFVRNGHELEDLGQEIFLRVWKGIGKYRGDAPLEHWIMRVALRTCYDFLRRQRHTRERELPIGDVPRLDAEHEPDAEMRSREAWEVVHAGLRQLNAKEQLILTLLELEEKSIAEVAAITGWSESNVKVRAFRARRKLRLVLEKKGYRDE